MIATNILSLYHLSSTTNFFQSTLESSPSSLSLLSNDHLLRQLHTIRAAINHLTNDHQKNPVQQLPPSPHPHRKIFSSSPPHRCHFFEEPQGLCNRTCSIKIVTFLVSTTRFGFRPNLHSFHSLLI
ncbi:hypothetical protein Bca52824_014831 [Brassica carinata]|uniref:Uncharacterized protein n=1 Tax=Brassica carinata TaxID=52824 RepID=A0A8X7W0I1_BRACI|nr:hypothetical protein Bca52824_014831 [Brassica carinata]